MPEHFRAVLLDAEAPASPRQKEALQVHIRGLQPGLHSGKEIEGPYFMRLFLSLLNSCPIIDKQFDQTRAHPYGGEALHLLALQEEVRLGL